MSGLGGRAVREDFVGAEEPTFGFGGAGAVDPCCCEVVGVCLVFLARAGVRWMSLRREGGKDVRGWGGVVELETTKERKRLWEVGEEVGCEGLEGGGVDICWTEGCGHCEIIYANEKFCKDVFFERK